MSDNSGLSATEKYAQSQLLNEKIKAVCAGLFIIAGILWWLGAFDSVETARREFKIGQHQISFTRLVTDARSAWRSAPNEIQREPMLLARDTALCGIPRQAEAWRGTVTRISTSGEDVFLNVSVAPNITLSSLGINRNSPLFSTIAQLRPGQEIGFGGSFPAGRKTCFSEVSLTTRGGMEDPDFWFKFESLHTAR